MSGKIYTAEDIQKGIETYKNEMPKKKFIKSKGKKGRRKGIVKRK